MRMICVEFVREELELGKNPLDARRVNIGLMPITTTTMRMMARMVLRVGITPR
jgi:hypothetical protein